MAIRRRVEMPNTTGAVMGADSQRMVWIDLEMTGLDVSKESIIEIATVITDSELNILARGPNLAISVSDELLEGMDDWNTTHHNKSGLVDRIRTDGVSLADAEQSTLEFLRAWVEPNSAPLCGNSVWNDRRFLDKEMPLVADYIHYRMVDVSTVKELARRWYPKVKRYRKKSSHLALDDILESIEELRYFRNEIFSQSE